MVDAGRSTLAWDWMHQNVGSWPYDGVGYHIYVGQSASATSASVAKATQTNLDGIWSAVTARDDQAARKQLWVSELGWRSRSSPWSACLHFSAVAKNH